MKYRAQMVLIGNVINGSGGRTAKNITLASLFVVSGTEERFTPDSFNTTGMKKGK